MLHRLLTPQEAETVLRNELRPSDQGLQCWKPFEMPVWCENHYIKTGYYYYFCLMLPSPCADSSHIIIVSLVQYPQDTMLNEHLIKKRICRNLIIKAKSTHTYSVSIIHFMEENIWYQNPMVIKTFGKPVWGITLHISASIQPREVNYFFFIPDAMQISSIKALRYPLIKQKLNTNFVFI